MTDTFSICFRCENWYHLDCVKIPEAQVELVDQFICPLCEDSASTHTTWKLRCARPTCSHPVHPLSKYCSDFCGMEVAASRLEITLNPPETKREDLLIPAEEEVDKFWEHVVGARRVEGMVVDATTSIEGAKEERWKRQEVEDDRVLTLTRRKLVGLSGEKSGFESQLLSVESRLKYLKLAIRRWEALCQATADEIAKAGLDSIEQVETPPAHNEDDLPTKNSRSKKKKNNVRKQKVVLPTNAPEAQCGLDANLILDDEEWNKFVKSGEGREALRLAEEYGDKEGNEGLMNDESWLNHVCLLPKKECERHRGWQGIREADFTLEQTVLVSYSSTTQLLGANDTCCSAETTTRQIIKARATATRSLERS